METLVPRKAPWWRTPAFFSYWLPPVLWCGAILAFSGDLGSSGNTLGLLRWLLSFLPSLSPGQLPVLHFYLRKAGHVLAYAALSFLWFRAVRGELSLSPRQAFFWALGLSLLVSLADEGHQSFFGTRTGCLADVGLDFSAAFLAALVCGLAWPRRPRPGSGPEDARRRQE
jgi:VanZ family protein